MDRLTPKIEEVLSLADVQCNGQADDKTLVRLEELMIDDTEARQVYLCYLFTHDQLNLQNDGGLQGLSAAPVLSTTSAGSRSKWFIMSTMVAAIFVVALFTSQSFDFLSPRDTTSPSTEKIGRVAQQWQAVWGDSEKALATWTVLKVGQKLDLLSGRVVCNFDVGAELILQGPVECQVVGPKQIKVDSGSVTVRVSENARGFSVVTARGKIIDLGTEFGVSVDPSGTTDLVVFDGMVDVEYDGQLQRVEMGRAVRLATNGTLTRIEQVDYDRFSRSGTFFQRRGSGEPVIESVSDNLRSEGVGPYYQVCHGGLVEGARAYVDRVYEWDGVDEAGIPDYLRGADYVLMFNDDKARLDFEVRLRLIQPAEVYVFWDDRFPPPAWLTSSFSPTGDYIEMDEYPRYDRQSALSDIGVGAGTNVKFLFSIWSVRVTNTDHTLVLGAIDQASVSPDLLVLDKGRLPVSMYGIAAVPATWRFDTLNEK